MLSTSVIFDRLNGCINRLSKNNRTTIFVAFIGNISEPLYFYRFDPILPKTWISQDIHISGFICLLPYQCSFNPSAESAYDIANHLKSSSTPFSRHLSIRDSFTLFPMPFVWFLATLFTIIIFFKKKMIPYWWRYFLFLNQWVDFLVQQQYNSSTILSKSCTVIPAPRFIINFPYRHHILFKDEAINKFALLRISTLNHRVNDILAFT